MFVNCNNGDAPWDDINTLTLSHISQPMGLSLAQHIFYSLLPSRLICFSRVQPAKENAILSGLLDGVSFANPTSRGD